MRKRNIPLFSTALVLLTLTFNACTALYPNNGSVQDTYNRDTRGLSQQYLGTPISMSGYPNSHWNNPQSVMSARSSRYESTYGTDWREVQAREAQDIRNSAAAAYTAESWVRVEAEHNRNTISGAATEASRGIIIDSGRSISRSVSEILDRLGGRRY